jgi:hypothetical protein
LHLPNPIGNLEFKIRINRLFFSPKGLKRITVPQKALLRSLFAANDEELVQSVFTIGEVRKAEILMSYVIKKSQTCVSIVIN